MKHQQGSWKGRHINDVLDEPAGAEPVELVLPMRIQLPAGQI